MQFGGKDELGTVAEKLHLLCHDCFGWNRLRGGTRGSATEAELFSRFDDFRLSLSFSFLQEHFTKNESIVEKEVQFTVDNPTHGRKTFIGLSDLDNRGFRHKHDMFLLELELRSIKTIFEQVCDSDLSCTD